MTTPQAPAVRRKQKARRSKQLAAWRLKTSAAQDESTVASPDKKASK